MLSCDISGKENEISIEETTFWKIWLLKKETQKDDNHFSNQYESHKYIQKKNKNFQLWSSWRVWCEREREREMNSKSWIFLRQIVVLGHTSLQIILLYSLLSLVIINFFKILFWKF
jgi:hypothetical protein